MDKRPTGNGARHFRIVMRNRRLAVWMASVLELFDKSLRNNKAYLGVMRRYDGSSGLELLARPLRTTSEAILASAQSLVERRLA